MSGSSPIFDVAREKLVSTDPRLSPFEGLDLPEVDGEPTILVSAEMMDLLAENRRFRLALEEVLVYAETMAKPPIRRVSSKVVGEGLHDLVKRKLAT